MYDTRVRIDTSTSMARTRRCAPKRRSSSIAAFKNCASSLSMVHDFMHHNPRLTTLPYRTQFSATSPHVVHAPVTMSAKCGRSHQVPINLPAPFGGGFLRAYPNV